MPTLTQLKQHFDAVVSAKEQIIPEHYTFYARGVLNSMLTSYLPVKASTITENDVSGEYLEALRMVITATHPDMKVGESKQFTYDDVMNALGGESIFKGEGPPQIDTIGETLRTTLGNFGVRRTQDGYEVFDTYDYEPVHEGGFLSHAQEALSDFQGGEGLYGAARTMGGFFMPENPDGTSKENVLRVRMRIPNETEVVDIDFDDDPPPEAEEFVFRGPMTNKRKSLWDSFTSMFISQAQAQTNDNLDPRLTRDLSTVRVMQLKGKQPFPMDGNDEYGRMNDAQRRIADMDLSELDG